MLTIEVTGELENALKAHAAIQGTTAEGVARRVLANALIPAEDTPATAMSGPDKARAFLQWASSHRTSAPPLSIETMSRASMYPDRW